MTEATTIDKTRNLSYEEILAAIDQYIPPSLTKEDKQETIKSCPEKKEIDSYLPDETVSLCTAFFAKFAQTIPIPKEQEEQETKAPPSPKMIVLHKPFTDEEGAKTLDHEAAIIKSLSTQPPITISIPYRPNKHYYQITIHIDNKSPRQAKILCTDSLGKSKIPTEITKIKQVLKDKFQIGDPLELEMPIRHKINQIPIDCGFQCALNGVINSIIIDSYPDVSQNQMHKITSAITPMMLLTPQETNLLNDQENYENYITLLQGIYSTIGKHNLHQISHLSQYLQEKIFEEKKTTKNTFAQEVTQSKDTKGYHAKTREAKIESRFTSLIGEVEEFLPKCNAEELKRTPFDFKAAKRKRLSEKSKTIDLSSIENDLYYTLKNFRRIDENIHKIKKLNTFAYCNPEATIEIKKYLEQEESEKSAIITANPSYRKIEKILRDTVSRDVENEKITEKLALSTLQEIKKQLTPQTPSRTPSPTTVTQPTQTQLEPGQKSIIEAIKAEEDLKKIESRAIAQEDKMSPLRKTNAEIKFCTEALKKNDGAKQYLEKTYNIKGNEAIQKKQVELEQEKTRLEEEEQNLKTKEATLKTKTYTELFTSEALPQQINQALKERATDPQFKKPKLYCGLGAKTKCTFKNGVFTFIITKIMPGEKSYASQHLKTGDTITIEHNPTLTKEDFREVVTSLRNLENKYTAQHNGKKLDLPNESASYVIDEQIPSQTRLNVKIALAKSLGRKPNELTTLLTSQETQNSR